jgi:hypothetical protein
LRDADGIGLRTATTLTELRAKSKEPENEATSLL